MAIRCDQIADIRKYEVRVAGPFTKRQLIYLLISILYALPIAINLPIMWVNKITAGCFIAMPGFVCGYVKIDGTPLEIFVLRLIYKFFLTPAKRKYKRKLLKPRRKITDTKKIRYSKREEFKIYR